MRKFLINTSLSSFLLFSSLNTFAEETKILSVKAEPLSALVIRTENSAPATVMSLNHATISAEIMGQVLTVSAETGDTVKKGQILTTLDCRSYELAKKQASAALQLARSQYRLSDKQFKRNQRLIKNGTIPRDLFDKVETSRQTALADIQLKKVGIDSAQLSISRCAIKAPFDGQISKRFVQQGQLVSPGTPLFRLLQRNKEEVRTKLSPKNIQTLLASPSILFTVGDKKMKATVRSIIKQIDEATRTQEVRLKLPPLKRDLAVGLSGRIVWENKVKKLPAEYLIRRNKQLGVMIADDVVEGVGKAIFHPLKKAKEGQAVEVSLPPHTRIITTNRFRVVDGQKIKIEKE